MYGDDEQNRTGEYGELTPVKEIIHSDWQG